MLTFLYAFLSIADSIVLVTWGLLDLSKFQLSDPQTRIYRRDGLFLIALGICGFGVWGIGRYKEKSLETQLAAANSTAALSRQRAAEADQKAEKFRLDIATANQRAAEANVRAKSAEAQVASANAASRDAVVKVANADARIAEANAKAAKADEKAEQEHLARIKIEERMRGRGLLAEQADRIVAKLSALKGYQADFGVTNETWEQIMLMKELERVFERAQWSVSENQAEATGPLGIAATTGVLVRPLGDVRSLDIAAVVSNALTAENIKAHISTPNATNSKISFPNSTPDAANKILIVVGDKPAF